MSGVPDKRGLRLVLRALWWGACAVVLVYPLVMAKASPKHLQHHWYEIQVVWMATLTFPVGIAYYVLLALGLTALDMVTSGTWGNSVAFLVLLQWLPAAALGYWQWFIWLPRRLRVWRAARESQRG